MSIGYLVYKLTMGKLRSKLVAKASPSVIANVSDDLRKADNPDFVPGNLFEEETDKDANSERANEGSCSDNRKDS